MLTDHERALIQKWNDFSGRRRAALKEAGTSCELHEMEEMPHAFMMIGDLSASGEGHRLMFNFLGRHV
jgi:hypothetical protein